jgi:hypothetical protein
LFWLPLDGQVQVVIDPATALLPHVVAPGEIHATQDLVALT